MKKYKKTLDNICYITYIDKADESENFEIVFYKKRGGQCPIQEFLDSLDVKMRTKALLMAALLREHGANLRLPYSKQFEDGIFELRAKQGSNITRLLYFFFAGKKAVLTNGFVKKTQKTPRAQIQKAKEYRSDYLAQIQTED
ncbi:MAG: type II toxin-antitoxin system RelE/ParE family toxin [Treponema sp.]|nr:type II toxin-antitoxin system RelE/ParE family toxin [Treponema sp.]